MSDFNVLLLYPSKEEYKKIKKRARAKIYSQTPEFKAAQKRYLDSPKGKAHKAEYSATYHLAHKEERNKASIKWSQEHKDYHYNIIRKWKIENKEHRYKLDIIWKHSHPEKVHNTNVKSYAKDKKGNNERVKAWYKTPKGKVLAKAIRHNRRRKLGFNAINNWFLGSHGHHINHNDVILIPADIHGSIVHKLNEPNTMKIINKIAFDYLTNNMRHI